MKLAAKHGEEACVSRTTSFEYWDEMPSQAKIESMAGYLEDVSIQGRDHKRTGRCLLGSSISCPRQIFQQDANLECRLLPSQSMHQDIYNTCIAF